MHYYHHNGANLVSFESHDCYGAEIAPVTDGHLFFLVHGDSDLSRRALALGTIVYHPEMVVTHDKQVKNRTLPEFLRRFGNALRYLNKHGWKF